MSTCTCKMCCSGPASASTDLRSTVRWISGRWRCQAGIGYVALLGLLAVVSTLALAFVHSAGVETAGNQTRIRHAQSEYLAQSAASHALWRLLNEPDFVPDATKYQMHDLAGGRYGYKVRRPGASTFATVSAVGAMDGSAIRQSYVPYIIPEDVITVYGRSADPLPDFRRMVGAGLSDPADTVNTGATAAYWMDLEGCPLRKEVVLATINDADTITLAVWNGAAWGNTHILGATGDRNFKCFDTAYESQSGRALAIGRQDASTTVYYNIWDGAAWTHPTPQPGFDISSGAIRTLSMASCPGNDHVLIAAVSWNNTLDLFLWNGTAFMDLGTIENSMETDDYGSVRLVYERQSGDALVIWTARGDVRYRIWNGASLGPEAVVTQFVSDVFFLSADEDPTSDHIVLAGIDKFFDLTIAVWDGDAWIDGREVETSNAANDFPGVDVAWESDGNEVLVAWAPWGLTTSRYTTWQKGTALANSTIRIGPDLQAQPWLIRLLPIAGSQQIMCLGLTNSNILGYSLWNGDRFKGDPAVELATNISAQNDLAFALAEADVPMAGGTGTGGAFMGNQPPEVNAGPDQTLAWPVSRITLSGTVSDDGKPDPPASVSTNWSLVSGPGVVVFDDATQLNTQLKVEIAGTYVFRLNASDSELSAADDVTVVTATPQILMTYGSEYFYVDMGGDITMITPDSSPKYRRFDGTTWSPNARVMALDPLVTNWMELIPASTRQEIIMGALQNDNSLQFAVWNGTGWGDTLQFSSMADRSTKCYATAYESQSGDALIIGRDGTGTAVKYTIWDGATWLHDPPALAFDMLGSGDVDVVEVAACPIRDEILIAVIDGGKDLRLYQWDGDAFNNLGLLTDDAITKSDGAVEIAYEQQSGHALIIYSLSMTSVAKFQTWDGIALSAQQSLPDFDWSANIIRAAGDPASDTIIAAALDAANDINMAVWDGDAWTDSREIATNAAAATRRCFDVAWLPTGGGALVVWGTSAQNNLSYLLWTQGSMLAGSAVQTGPGFYGTILGQGPHPPGPFHPGWRDDQYARANQF